MEKEEMLQNEEQKKNEEIEYKDATIEERKVAKIIKERIGTENEIVNEYRTEEGKIIENLLNALLNL